MAKTETQRYQVITKEKDFEIRLYPSATMATITMDATTYKELSSPGFKKLANFIFGGNDENKSISMTTPVYMDINDDQSSMSFVMPSEYDRDNLPKPTDSTVNIKTTEEEFVGAIEFTGFANDEEIKKQAAKLAERHKASNIEFNGNFRYLGYSAPWQVVDRKNEIIVNVKWNAQ